MASPRLQLEFMYSRFVNIQGRAGHNIPCDLHMEHLNRYIHVCTYILRICAKHSKGDHANCMHTSMYRYTCCIAINFIYVCNKYRILGKFCGVKLSRIPRFHDFCELHFVYRCMEQS